MFMLSLNAVPVFRRHLCPIAFPCNADNWTDVFEVPCSLKFPPVVPNPSLTTSRGVPVVGPK